jgi:two-component system sensor histidine kinase QseC
LRHNPTGTCVEVRVARDALGQVTLSVSDDGGDFSAARAADPDTGLGIGLTLVERIAQSQGAQLVRDAGSAPFGKRFALVWPATGHQPGKA